jgi:hypothetical protein
MKQKQPIKLNEAQLRRIVRESVISVLNDLDSNERVDENWKGALLGTAMGAASLFGGGNYAMAKQMPNYNNNIQITQKNLNNTLNAVKNQLIDDFFNNWDASTHEPTDELSRAIRILNSQSTDRSVNQEILRNAVVPYFLGLSNGSAEINDVQTLNNYIANCGKTENLVIVKVGGYGAVIDFNVASNIVNKYIKNARLNK